MSANFTPTKDSINTQGTFRFWCQKTLPLVYDDSLSYYEVLCKLAKYISDFDVQGEVNEKITEYLADGTLLNLIKQAELENITIYNKLNNIFVEV